MGLAVNDYKPIANNLLKHAGYFLILTLVIIFMTTGWAEESDDGHQNEYQARFEQGAKSFLSGKYFIAAGIFEQLYVETHSLRVKLEWARSLYFMGEKDKAKKLFEEVLATNPPLSVREKIIAFLDDIAISNGKFNYDFGIVRDTNPRLVPNNTTFYIFGAPLTYKPQFDTGPKYGMSYSLSASRSLDSLDKLVGTISTYGIKFDSAIFDQNTVQAALTYRLNDTPRVQARLSFETMSYGGEHLYDYPSASISYATENVIGDYWTNEIKGGRLAYPVYSYLNGPLFSYTTSVSKYVSPQIIMGVELYVDQMNALENPYAYATHSVSLFSNFYQEYFRIKSQLKFSYSSRKYDATDPFFGQKRSDKTNSVMLTLLASEIKIFGGNPTLEIGYQQNNSNIGFYSYGKMTINIYFKKAY